MILHHVGVGERYVDEGVERETNEEKWTHIDKINVYIDRGVPCNKMSSFTVDHRYATKVGEN